MLLSSSILSASILDTTILESNLPYPFQSNQNGGLFMNNPGIIKTYVEYDPIRNEYYEYKRIGKRNLGRPKIMSFEEYHQYQLRKLNVEYWDIRTGIRKEKSSSAFGLPKLYVGGKAFDRVFGGNAIDIRPQGSAELIFSLRVNRLDNPSLPEEQRRTTSFDFVEKIQMNVIGKIGEKLKLTTNYNTESTFDFENQMKLEYTGEEDDIIKKLEVGNVSLPLNGTLITGSQSLFGMKAQLQFGRTTITSILSQQKSKTSEVEVNGGAQTTEFDIYADNYEANKHFFLAHYFKDQYDKALQNLPFVNSQINITKIEVWITNKTGAVENTRNLVSFLDLGETEIYNPDANFSGSNIFKPVPDNSTNNLFFNLTNNFLAARDINQVNYTFGPYSNVFFSSQDYEKLERARKLTESEYTLHTQLGYISLNQALNNDEVLAVAFQYTYGNNTYQVGELSTTGPNAPDALFVKLLKGTNLSPKLPNWDLMMKNIYAIGAYQMSSKDFILDIVYENTQESGGITNYIPDGILDGTPLIKVLNLDNLNLQQDRQSDGVFDFIEGVTVKSSNGRIIFPVREPFGSYLRTKFNQSLIADKYVYESLYDSTLIIAQQYPELNKFRLKGSFQASSGAEISLNAMNVPEGSVTVTAGSQKLIENQDYTVDYMLGRVTIINEGILNSGIPIKISLENNALYGIQNKTLIGTHVDYEINKDFIIGATVLNLTERPFTVKINTGDEPISNTIWGLDGTFQKESPFITKMVDKLPFLETKAKSTIIATAEFAHLIPGHHKSLGSSGVSYIDDFEASKTSIDMKNMGAWVLSSIPQGQDALFPGANEDNNLVSGFNRAKVAWYTIDPLFYRTTSLTPPGINKLIALPNGNTIPQKSYHYSREVLEKEVFPNKDPDLGSQITNQTLLDIAYYPQQRGPYNFNVSDLNFDGTMSNPFTKWAGVMRKVETNDFETANIEFIEFWMMDPFNNEDGDQHHTGGNLYFHLGNVSEDILKDGYKSFENGLPVSSIIENVDTTAWGRVPTNFSIVNAFDNDPNSRAYQDVGIDGLKDTDELQFFDNSYILKIANDINLGVSSQAYQNAIVDPSGDNYHYYRGGDYDNVQLDILSRYLHFNNMEGNSVTTDQSPESYPTSATTIPNTEDINNDNTLSEGENYFQYKVPIFPSMDIGDSYISDVFTSSVKTDNGVTRLIKWYQFRIPIYNPDKIIGGIQDFKSIRFMRMIFSGFEQPIICRFATLDLVRGEWRRYNFDLSSPGEYLPIDEQDNTLFDISAVNVEENGKRKPINYVIPPGIEQEIDNSTTTLRKQNEQSLVLKVCNLRDGDSRAAYKKSDLDVRAYKRIKMFVHAEGKTDNLNNGDLSCFIRLGTDFTSNYYEYEISLDVTRHGETNQNLIWPSVNEIDIAFEEFQKAKQIRNEAIRKGIHNTSDPFIKYLSNNKKIQIVGNPNFSRIKTIMIGIRNPKKLSNSSDDDGLEKCGQIWVNELRLTDFDEYGGWAANSRLTTKLADFGTVTLSGNISTIGFGSIEKKINERQRVNAYQYDISSTFELAKFFPENYGLKIPMYIGLSEDIKNPQYNPLDPDILFETTLETLDSKDEKDSFKHIAQDYVKRKSINFTNIRKMTPPSQKNSLRQKESKPRIYDPENFTLSYSFNETFIRNINTEYNRTRFYRGAITYNYHTTPRNIKPFTNMNIGKSKYLKLIKDFNFNTMPKSFSFRTDLERSYNETQLRNINNSNMIILPTYNKFFNWNRMYELKYDLTRTLKVDFSVNNKAVIDEPAGGLSKDEPFYKQKRDTIWRNFWDFGRATLYHQTFNINYQVPINKIPFLNFVSLSTRYSANYDWTSNAKSLQYLGNNIQNSNTKQFNGQINMNTIYNKVPYFKRINQNRNNRRGNIRNNQEKDSEKSDRYEIFNYFTGVLLAIKNISFNYSENRGTLLPGFIPKPHFLGQQWSMMAPGIPFVFGSQNDIRQKAASKHWLTRDTTLNTLFRTTNSSNLTLRSTLEPIKQFRIELTANKNKSLNKQEYWRASSKGVHSSFARMETGSFSISIISFSTAFLKDDSKYSSKSFSNFRNFRNDIAKRLAAENPNFSGGINPLTGFPLESTLIVNPDGSVDTNYTGGYGPNSQDVIIPAFLAAYTGKDPINASLNKFPVIPLPNWRITYDGLIRIGFIKRYFKTFTIGHAYRSTYSVGSFSTNLDYKDIDGNIRMNLNNLSYHTEYDIAQISINEQFSPLFKVDMTWKNSLTARFEIKKTRMLSLSLGNNQLTEIRNNEYVIGTGFRVKDVAFKFRSSGRSKKINSDLNFKLDLNIRNNKTIIRKIIEDVEQITAGQRIISIKFSTDYVFNNRLNIKAFYDKVITNPFISTTFPGAITNAGFSLRFTLAG